MFVIIVFHKHLFDEAPRIGKRSESPYTFEANSIFCSGKYIKVLRCLSFDFYLSTLHLECCYLLHNFDITHESSNKAVLAKSIAAESRFSVMRSRLCVKRRKYKIGEIVLSTF